VFDVSSRNPERLAFMRHCARILVMSFAMVACAGLGGAWAQESPARLRKAPERPAIVAKTVAPSDPAVALKATDWRAEGTHGAVAAGGRYAVASGLEVLRRGGNAADAGAATILALSVTDSTQFCFGGEVPILVYDAKSKSVVVIAGQGVAPGLATREEFAKYGSTIPLKGIRPAAVPAALDACLVLLERFGTITFREAIEPTRQWLERPVAPADWHQDFARTLGILVESEAAAHRAGTAMTPGDRSRGLRLVADAFYRGPIARRIDAWSRANGGLIRYEDLAKHVTHVEEPVSARYRDLDVFKCGPWTQGPYLLEALQILDGINLKAMGRNRPATTHLIVESLALAMADRDTYYADPLFADVPLERLLRPEYAASRRALIDPLHASLERRPGDPRGGKPLLDPSADPAARHVVPLVGTVHDTTTCVVADGMGNMVAATPSGWSGVVAGDTGVWLGSRLQSFNLWPDHPDVIVPGKRPRITLSPTLVLRDGQPVLAISVAGGDNQDQMTLQLLLDAIDFDLEPAVSVVAPRFMSDHFIGSFGQKPPALGQLRINPEVGPEMLDALVRMGHRLVVKPGPLSAAPCVISFDRKTGVFRAAGDPRAVRHALAY
jgi:gamma-glutamyltranspeptidase/glutathione hydrolase